MNTEYRLGPITVVAIVLVAGLALFAGMRTAAADDQTVAWSLPATSSVTINTGDTVTWTLADALPHTVTSLTGPGSFASAQLSGSGQTFAFTFTAAGTYTYQCNVHPGSMTGTVVVEAAGDDGATAMPTQTPGAPTTGTGSASHGDDRLGSTLLLISVFVLAVAAATGIAVQRLR